MNIISLDPGTYHCGYAVFVDGKLIFAGEWEIKERIDTRLTHILNSFGALLIQYKPCEIACERAFSTPKKKVPELETLIRGARGMARRYKQRFFLYSPRAIFGRWNGKREVARLAEQQQQILRFARNDSFSEHAIDAVLVGQYHLRKMEVIKGEGD